MKPSYLILLLVLTSTIATAAEPPPFMRPIERPVLEIPPVSEKDLQASPSKDWLMWRGNYGNWGFSPLKQITTKNVSNLGLAWAIGIDPGSNQTTPLVHKGVMYLAHPKDVITAHNATNGDLLWEYRRTHTVPPWGPGMITRNIAISGDKIFHATYDAAVIALDKNSGKLVWESRVGDPAEITHSSGPIVAGGRVFTGRACGYKDSGGCFIAAHEAETGNELWRRYFIPKPGELGDDTWGGLPFDERKHVGAWLPGAYDAELDILYWGTTGPAPSPEILRGGQPADMMFTNSTLALNPASGEIKWHFQHLPRDNWDVDHAYERILVDASVTPSSEHTWVRNPSLPDEKAKLMTGIPGKTGIVWTLNRETGEFYWAKQTQYQNVVTAIDADTGRVSINEELIATEIDGEPILVCPSLAGGRDWQAGAFHPNSGLMVMPMHNICMKTSAKTDPRYGLKIAALLKTPGEEMVGRIDAIHVETGETAWSIEQPHGAMATLTTAGGLLFAGDLDRRFRAYDMKTGETLWEISLGGAISGFPISYEVDGVQYVAIAVGGGGGGIPAWSFVSGITTTRPGGNTLYVFAVSKLEAREYEH